WLQALHPFGIGGPIAALVDTRRCPLEHVQMPGVAAEGGKQLDAPRTRADQRAALVRELVQARVLRGATGVRVIPARRVEHPPLEALDAGDAGQLRLAPEPERHDHEARPDVVAAR